MTEAQKEVLKRFSKFDVVTDHGTYFFLNSKKAEKTLKHNPKGILRILIPKPEEVKL